MRLDFRLLVIDDEPDQIDGALTTLQDFLDTNGFGLTKVIPTDLAEGAIGKLARHEGKNFDLAVVDFNLGGGGKDGAILIKTLRSRMKYTDMVFFSSDSRATLLSQLAGNDIDGVFVAGRRDLDETLKGVASTIIGKAIDLSHMRGIAMAEVAELDLMMEETLLLVFESGNEPFSAKASRTLKKYFESTEERLTQVKPLVEGQKIIELIADSSLFGSMDRYKAMMRILDCLKPAPEVHLTVFKTYENDIIKKRNILAHAREHDNGDGTYSLKSFKPNVAATVIDESWMTDFRQQLRHHRASLHALCTELRTFHAGLVQKNGK
jgi:CheY-like chemotaxis protein